MQPASGLIAVETPPRLLGSALGQHLLKLGLPVYRRAPGELAGRWLEHRIAGVSYPFAQPLTFTPYASVRPCSARCQFCSENLRRRDAGTAASLLRPGNDYFVGLRRALQALRGVPRSYSLSGLEASDDPAWLLQLLALLDEPDFAADSQQKVLYSNGAGLAGEQADALLAALGHFRLSWLELSRHHPDAARNQQIMRFRPGQAIQQAAVFDNLLQRCRDQQLPVRLVCLLQQGGVDSPQDVADYLDWAAARGVDTVIFRELSRLDEGYRDNATRRYIDSQRVPMEALLAACLADPQLGPALQAQRLTDGYYFWNLHLRHRGGPDVIFECSDYRAMHSRHAEDRIYKLVYFADGQLCSGWQPGDNLLLDCRHG